MKYPKCTCTVRDNGGRPLPKDRINMLHRSGCPLVRAAWAEYHRRVQAGETSMAQRVKRP